MSRRVLAGTVVALVVVLVAWYALLWSPRDRQLTEAKSEREVAETELAAAELQLHRLEALDARRGEIEAEQAALIAAVPATSELAGLIRSLDTAADEAGVDLLSINPTAPTASTAPGVPSSVGVTVQLSGGYVDTIDLLRRIAASGRLFVIDGVTFSPEDAEEGSIITTSLTARAFTSESGGVS